MKVRTIKDAARELGITVSTLQGRIRLKICPLPTLRVHGYKNPDAYDETQFELLQAHFAEQPKRKRSNRKNTTPTESTSGAELEQLSEADLLEVVLARLCSNPKFRVALNELVEAAKD